MLAGGHAAGEGRADLAPLHLGEDDGRVGLGGEDGVGLVLVLGARAGPVLPAVKPDHGALGVPPDGHGQHHAARHGVAHLLQRPQVHEPRRPRRRAKLVRDAVHGRRVRLGHRLRLDHDAVLDVQPLDLEQLARRVRGELRHHRKGARRVHGELAAAAVVLGLIQAVVVPTASVLVAHALGLALGALAQVQGRLVARVRRDLRGARVGLPDVHLVAAHALGFDVALERELDAAARVKGRYASQCKWLLLTMPFWKGVT